MVNAIEYFEDGDINGIFTHVNVNMEFDLIDWNEYNEVRLKLNLTMIASHNFRNKSMLSVNQNILKSHQILNLKTQSLSIHHPNDA